MSAQEPRSPLPEGSERLRQALDASAQGLDAATLSRLNRARQAALATLPSRSRWRTPLHWGLALAACAALALALRPQLQSPASLPADAVPPVDLSLLALDSEVEPALLEDLEFYAWLDTQADSERWDG